MRCRVRPATFVFALTLALLASGCIIDGGEPLPEPAEPLPEEAEAGRADAEPDAEPDAGPAGCLPYDDRCPEGEYCQYVERLGLTCIPNGDVVPDPNHHTQPMCPEGVCSRGGICMPDPRAGGGGDLRCFETCGPDDASRCFNGRHTCREALDGDGAALGFGLCDY